MNIINYLPGILIAICLAIPSGLVLRLIAEGANMSTIIKSVARFFSLPIFAVVVTINIHEHRRNIIFQLRSSSEHDEKIISKMEYYLESKLKIFLLLTKLLFVLHREFLDMYIDASIEFEKKNSLKRKIVIKQPNFFEYLGRLINIEKRIFQYV